MFIKEFSDLTLSEAGVRARFFEGVYFGAHFKLDQDVSQLFPYINAAVQGAKYYGNPDNIQFEMDDVRCTLYPKDVMAAAFENEEQAAKFAQRLMDFLNNLHSEKNSVKPNYKKYKPISVLDVFKLLPQTNCKKCGFLTCMAFAGALSQRQTTPDKCPDFSDPIAETIVYPVFDKDGRLSSTIELDIDIEKRDLHEKEQKEGADNLQDNRTSPEKDDPDIQTDLTGREIEVLRLMAEGATNTEISKALSISPHTVKSHVIHIFNKLSVNDRTQAAVWATRNKLV
jgi:ArsR family metal-binding transcriptional regulator/DNA-binding CsgD family transcriptional regulator